MIPDASGAVAPDRAGATLCGMIDDDDDDAALFRDAIGKVAPLRSDAAPPPARPRPRPTIRRDDPAGPLSTSLAAADGSTLERGDVSAFRRERVPAQVWQRLRRGQFSAQDELDLHGANALQAELLLARFIVEATDAGMGCVRIIHGKGAGADTAVPVLKNLVDRVLRQRGDVLAFHSAPPAQGGTGALLVLLAAR